MIRSLFSGATGMNAQQLTIDNISNNIANVNTTSFKKSNIHFQDLMYQTIEEAGSATSESTTRPNELSIGAGVRVVSTKKDFTQGNIQNTGNPLDVSINGNGFFQVVKGDGTLAYTRDGSFRMNESGQLTTSDGYYLEPSISFPSDTSSVNITKDGVVFAKLFGQTDPTEVGQLELARFINPAGLKANGSNLYTETTSSGSPILGTPGGTEYGSLEQGYLETSNVEIVDEMVNMITAQRAYELNSKSVTTADKMMQTANSLKR